MHPGFDLASLLTALFVSVALFGLLFDVNPVAKARNLWRVKAERKVK